MEEEEKEDEAKKGKPKEVQKETRIQEVELVEVVQGVHQKEYWPRKRNRRWKEEGEEGRNEERERMKMVFFVSS